MSNLLPSITQSEKATPVSCFGYRMPLYPSEKCTLCSDMKTVAKARKQEKKLRSKFDQKIKSDTTFTSAAKNKDAAYPYLSSGQCLIVAMLDANKRRRYRQRLSLRQIIEAAKAYKVLLELNEPVIVYRKPKSAGSGFRTICDFGPVARGAQRMVLTLLREAYTPAPFQYTRLGVHEAIKEALRLITEEEYTHVAEIDIKNHFPSFEGKKLIEALPLPNGAIREIILAQSAIWKPHGVLSYMMDIIMHQTQLGIPQGSAASTVVAEWSVSQLDFKVQDVALVNYADNFFLFAKNATTLKHALEALRSAIAGLPGGSFATHPAAGDPSSIGTVTDGFRMLGCKIVKTDGTVVVCPSETSLGELRHRVKTERADVCELFAAAKDPQSPTHRFEAVQAYLRLQHYVASWMSAHSFCIDFEVYYDDVLFTLAELQAVNEITEDEMKAASDQSVKSGYHPKSGWMKT